MIRTYLVKACRDDPADGWIETYREVDALHIRDCPGRLRTGAQGRHPVQRGGWTTAVGRSGMFSWIHRYVARRRLLRRLRRLCLIP